jgi:hypothetical protein
MGVKSSDDIKNLMLRRCSFGNGYVGAVYEIPELNNADVVAVKHGGKIQEFEIKVSRADLVGELRAARVAAGLDDIKTYIKKDVQANLFGDSIERTPEQIEAIYNMGHTLSKTKLEKHRFYLNPEHPGRDRMAWEVSTNYFPPKRFVPNTFYWCISVELMEICKTLNKGLPYGIYVYDLPQTSKYYQKFIVKSGRSLGGQGDKLYFNLFNRACTLWGSDRYQVEYLNKKFAEKDAT